MKKLLRLSLLTISLFAFVSCGDTDDIVETQNTAEFFKISFNGSPEQVYDQYAKGGYVANTNSPFQKFSFRAGAEDSNGDSFVIDGDFTFQDLNAFLTTNTFNWGISDGITANFYITRPLGGFFPDLINLASNPVVCTVTENPTNVGDYIAFTFTGSYLDLLDNSSTKIISGSGRILRTADR